MKNKQEINRTHVIIASIIGVSIIGFGMLQLENSDRAREESRRKFDMEQDQKIETTIQQEANQRKLENCLFDAEAEFQKDFELNSEPIVVEGKKDVRRWNSVSLQERTEKSLLESKDFCLKRFGN